MNTKIARLFLAIAIGIGVSWGMFTSLATPLLKAQEAPCSLSENESECYLPENKGTAAETAVPSFVQDAPQETPIEQALKEAYERILIAGDYKFTAESEQTLLPRPLPEMIGQTD